MVVYKSRVAFYMTWLLLLHHLTLIFGCQRSVATDASLVRTSLEIIAGYPAFTMVTLGSADTVKFLRAEDHSGVSWPSSELAVKLPPSAAYVYYDAVLKSIAGRAAVLTSRMSGGTPTEKIVEYFRAANAIGTAWPLSVEFVASNSTLSPLQIGMIELEVEPLPLVVWTTPIRINIRRALNADGTQWTAVHEILNMPVEAPLGARSSMSVAMVNNKPAVCYVSVQNRIVITEAKDVYGDTWNTGGVIVKQNDAFRTNPILLGLASGDYVVLMYDTPDAGMNARVYAYRKQDCPGPRCYEVVIHEDAANDYYAENLMGAVVKGTDTILFGFAWRTNTVEMRIGKVEFNPVSQTVQPNLVYVRSSGFGMLGLEGAITAGTDKFMGVWYNGAPTSTGLPSNSLIFHGANDQFGLNLPETCSLRPSASPTLSPVATLMPSDAPTRSPTSIPSRAPTRSPTLAPTHGPSLAPTRKPSLAPTARPSNAPLSPGEDPNPTNAPTLKPTTIDAPTLQPTLAPAMLLTDMPSEAPTLSGAGVSQVPTPRPTVMSNTFSGTSTQSLPPSASTASFSMKSTPQPLIGNVSTNTGIESPSYVPLIVGISAVVCLLCLIALFALSCLSRLRARSGGDAHVRRGAEQQRSHQSRSSSRSSQHRKVSAMSRASRRSVRKSGLTGMPTSDIRSLARLSARPPTTMASPYAEMPVSSTMSGIDGLSKNPTNEYIELKRRSQGGKFGFKGAAQRTSSRGEYVEMLRASRQQRQQGGAPAGAADYIDMSRVTRGMTTDSVQHAGNYADMSHIVGAPTHAGYADMSLMNRDAGSSMGYASIPTSSPSDYIELSTTANGRKDTGAKRPLYTKVSLTNVREEYECIGGNVSTWPSAAAPPKPDFM